MTVNNEAIALSASTIIPPSSKLIPVIGVSDLVNLGTIYLDGAMPTVPALKFKVTSLSTSLCYRCYFRFRSINSFSILSSSNGKGY